MFSRNTIQAPQPSPENQTATAIAKPSPPFIVAGLKFIIDKEGRLFPSYMGGGWNGSDFKPLLLDCLRRWSRGDYSATMYALQKDDRGACSLTSTETNTEPGKRPAILDAIAEAIGTASPPAASSAEPSAEAGERLPASHTGASISEEDAQTIAAMIAAYEAQFQQQAAQIAELTAQLEANSAILRQVSAIEKEFAEIHAERAGIALPC